MSRFSVRCGMSVPHGIMRNTWSLTLGLFAAGEPNNTLLYPLFILGIRPVFSRYSSLELGFSRGIDLGRGKEWTTRGLSALWIH